ncbi:LPXTG family cell wall anchor protein [Staphylococcus agnetis]|uniref:fibrinogen-binding adhesin SdrG C-terminal domain-containing protein n=1 Tax=Staphylococcus agnetis TaxID=985762 RepID=UPI000DFC74E9|nr:fibrinogen-binding adhesin SdrG C-terminal domain-containing protein [Staphylococcus agnetis]SUK16488.1 LPXTG family cell wall anchor protein [Staphylococcus agnetis]
MNNKQRYSIRKYRIGAASIALGTIAVIGVTDQSEAHASETSGNQAIEFAYNDSNVNTNSSNKESIQTEVIGTRESFNNNDHHINNNINTINASDLNSDKHINETSPLVSNESRPKEVEAPSMANETLKYKTGMGVNVTNKVNVVTSSITSKDASKIVNPHNAERVTLNYDWKFSNDLKQGDYFDFTISDNVDTKGISTNRKMPEIKTKDNKDVIAYGEVLSNNNLRYYFTNYVNGKTDLSAQLALNLYFKPSVVLNNGTQEVSSKLGDHIVKNNFDVKYLNGVTDYYGMNINGRMVTLNKENNSFSHYIYINPTKQSMKNVEITGTFVKGKPTGESQPTIKIYKYLNNKALPQSVYSNFNSKDFEDVTKSFDVKINNGEYSTKFNDLNGETYIIKYEGNYNKIDSDLTFRTFLKGVYAQYPYSYRTLTWDNGVQFYSNNASGSGKDKPSEPIIQAGQPIDLDYVTQETISGNGEYVYTEETEDTRPVEIVEDTLHGSNHATGVIEFEEDTHAGGGQTNHTSDVIEFEEDTAKGIITGAVSDHTTLEDTMEYMTDNHLIEFEEKNTLPPSISGHAEGVIEEIEDNHHIDIVEITTPEGETGHVDGIIDIVEDNHLIDFEENTGNGEIKGEVNGTIEEVEDSSVINIISEIGTENGSNNMTFEEDTDNDRPSIENGAHDPIEIIEDTIMIENGHTKGVLVEEEDTQPPHPNEPKEEQPDIPETPKNNVPKKDNEFKPAPKVKEDSPRMVEEKEESPKTDEVVPKVVNEKPKFKAMSTISNKVNNDGKAHVKHDEKHHLHEELPRTGSESGQQPILVAGLMSLIGLVLLKRRKRDI